MLNLSRDELEYNHVIIWSNFTCSFNYTEPKFTKMWGKQLSLLQNYRHEYLEFKTKCFFALLISEVWLCAVYVVASECTCLNFTRTVFNENMHMKIAYDWSISTDWFQGQELDITGFASRLYDCTRAVNLMTDTAVYRRMFIFRSTSLESDKIQKAFHMQWALPKNR